MTTVILCGSLIDCTGGEPIPNAEIHVVGDRIRSIEKAKGASRPRDAEVVDLRDLTILPGLVDCHDHFCMNVGDEEAQCAEPQEYIALVAANNAHKILRAGITTVRSLGETGVVGQMLKRAINEGLVQGPRIITSGRLMVRSGGHGWFLGHQADGADALRAAVREEVGAGADLIKIMVTGGMSTRGSDPMAAEFTDEEVAALIDEAHRRGRKVAAHAHGGPGVASAVKAGVDSIEHGLFLTADDVQLMVKRGTWLVVTASVLEAMLSEDSPEFMRAKTRGVEAGFKKMLAATKGTGLKIAVGTDENHGMLYRDIDALRQAGYTPMEALLAGTKHGSVLCGVADQVGTLETGKMADLIAVRGDPLADFSHLRDPLLVMKGGKIEFSDGRAPDVSKAR